MFPRRATRSLSGILNLLDLDGEVDIYVPEPVRLFSTHSESLDYETGSRAFRYSPSATRRAPGPRGGILGIADSG